MNWFVPIVAATCAVPMALSQALPEGSSPSRSEAANVQDAPRVCLNQPDWFAVIHRYYDCNPAITPTFDFASLYRSTHSKPSMRLAQPR